MSESLEIFYERLLKHLARQYPAACGDADVLKSRLSPKLLSPHILPLPMSLREEAERIVRAFWALRSLPEWQVTKAALAPAVQDPGHSSVLMSYDFHIDVAGHLRLIEINTNASMSLFAEALHELHGIPNSFARDFSAEIVKSFEHELGRAPSGVAITDEKPESQRMYIEFLMYQELFTKAGWKTRIADTSDLRTTAGGDGLSLNGEKIDLVYNRNTDFYLQGESASGLAAANAQGSACVTPNPFEYRLLADKERLLELSEPGVLESLNLSDEDRDTIRASLIRTLDVQKVQDVEALRKDRKRWFFKPMRSFGSKAAYRGSSITKGVWANILEGEYVAQEYVPAPVVSVMSEGGDGAPTEFKYDLRFYVYEDRIQIAAARFYQGQTTNSQTPGGGLTVIRWDQQPS